MDRYVCIHGHFYQPPRENPWLEFIEVQDSAYPNHDWNERIDSQCYGPNAAARILDADEYVSKIVNNYARISFNVGPTLFAWLEQHDPAAYAAILSADAESRERFSGHGSALAQPYNHMIMPLANRRDKSTQVVWGIRDFEHRFGRHPEGMWLPETAVDLETLEVLAEHGIRFTVLAPHQAVRTRELDGSTWEDVQGGRVDPTRAYRVELPSGKAISAFFYDGPASKAVAFEGVLHRGEHLADRLLSSFNDARTWPQLVNIAADGETYGHHHRYGEMALAYAIDLIESSGKAQLTNYAAYLAAYPPRQEVILAENTSWSCPHGIERWRSDCGCQTGGKEGWNQAWRGPLRDALDALRDHLGPEFEKTASGLLKDPWRARDDYIDVILNRSSRAVDAFLRDHAVGDLDDATRRKALHLLEMQRHLMLMYTSCGWFFNDISGIETVQILQYAARAVELAEGLFEKRLETSFLTQLQAAKSNVAELADGRMVYERFVAPARVGLEQVAAHYAIRSLFEPYPDHIRMYCYSVDLLDDENFERGKARLRVGRAQVRSEITQDASTLSFGALRLDDHGVNGGVRVVRGEEEHAELVRGMGDAFRRGEFPQVVRLMETRFGSPTYSIRSLFRDDQRKVVDQILGTTLGTVHTTARALFEQNASLVQLLGDQNVPFYAMLRSIADIAIGLDLRQALEQEDSDAKRIEKLLADAEALGIALDSAGLEYALVKTVNRVAHRFADSPGDMDTLRRLGSLLELAQSLPFDADLWEVQNVYYGLLQSVYPGFRDGKGPKGVDLREWVDRFRQMGESLSIRVK